MPLNIEERQAQLRTQFAEVKSWEDRYKKIIQMGKELPAAAPELHDERYLVKGCQSQVWLKAEPQGQARLHLIADSDALIVKGLVAILLFVYDGATYDEILSTPPTFMKDMGLDQHLSPSRANGVMAMIKQVVLYATALKSLG